VHVPSCRICLWLKGVGICGYCAYWDECDAVFARSPLRHWLTLPLHHTTFSLLPPCDFVPPSHLLPALSLRCSTAWPCLRLTAIAGLFLAAGSGQRTVILPFSYCLSATTTLPIAHALDLFSLQTGLRYRFLLLVPATFYLQFLYICADMPAWFLLLGSFCSFYAVCVVLVWDAGVLYGASLNCCTAVARRRASSRVAAGGPEVLYHLPATVSYDCLWAFLLSCLPYHAAHAHAHTFFPFFFTACPSTLHSRPLPFVACRLVYHAPCCRVSTCGSPGSQHAVRLVPPVLPSRALLQPVAVSPVLRFACTGLLCWFTWIRTFCACLFFSRLPLLRHWSLVYAIQFRKHIFRADISYTGYCSFTCWV